MLLHDFYYITQFEPSDKDLSAEIRLNPKHDIYRGHFPEQAIVPGVVQLQIIKELLEQALSEELLMTEVILAKYLNMITPVENQMLHIHLKWSFNKAGGYLINASVSNNETVFTKLKAHFSKPVQKG